MTAAYDGGQAIWARRYDADRRVVSLAHWVGTRFQADVSYDAQGNITEHRISYVTEPPFWTPASGDAANVPCAVTPTGNSRFSSESSPPRLLVATSL